MWQHASSLLRGQLHDLPWKVASTECKHDDLKYVRSCFDAACDALTSVPKDPGTSPHRARGPVNTSSTGLPSPTRVSLRTFARQDRRVAWPVPARTTRRRALHVTRPAALRNWYCAQKLALCAACADARAGTCAERPMHGHPARPPSEQACAALRAACLDARCQVGGRIYS